jgi:endo-1,4-beta-xylanase
MEASKIIVFVLMTTALPVLAQPTSSKIDEQAAGVASYLGDNKEEKERNKVVEQEYLEAARKSIEKIRKGDASIVFVDPKGKPIRNLQVEVNQVTQDFLFGNLVFHIAGFAPKGGVNDADLYKQRFKDLFNLAVFPFYWGRYESLPGNPDWMGNQSALEWCLANGITCKGHTLGWTSPAGTPRWLLNQSPEIATELYKARIFNNVIGYKGKIDIWDVVNEPVNTVPWEMALADRDNNNDFRYNMNGIEVDQIVPWVEKSYKWAHEANTDGNYILNEYFTLAIPEIRDRFYRLIKELIARNTPISGIGIQGHEPREMWFSPVEMYKTFDLYSEFKLPIHITEFIPQSSGKAITGWRSGIWTEETQAEFAEKFYTLAFGHPSIASITWWGLSDKNIWLPGGGLLDNEYNPKPVYNSLMKLIKQDWMTKNLNLVSGRDGKTAFRGFFGEYEIVLSKKDGSQKVFKMHLKENENNQWKYVID